MLKTNYKDKKFLIVWKTEFKYMHKILVLFLFLILLTVINLSVIYLIIY